MGSITFQEYVSWQGFIKYQIYTKCLSSNIRRWNVIIRLCLTTTINDDVAIAIDDWYDNNAITTNYDDAIIAINDHNSYGFNHSIDDHLTNDEYHEYLTYDEYLAYDVYLNNDDNN